MLKMPTHPSLQFTQPLPYGAILHERGVQFIVFSRSATAMRLLLYDAPEDREPSEIIAFDRESDRWGDVWSIFVSGIGAGQLYHFQADGPYDPERGMWFNGQARLVDPWAKALAGTFLPATDGIVRPPKSVVVDDHFDWQGDRHLRRDLSETIIYELHVKGFTNSDTSGVAAPGTYLGLIDKIPYLEKLGVTAVELMPVHAFADVNPYGLPGGRRNYWGYDSYAFFAPHHGYQASDAPGGVVREFKEMVRAFHQAGIEVILDVVYNHTAEGNELGPILSFKGLENHVYYMLENGGSRYKNYSGCGNTVNGNHPIVRELIFQSLRHWVHNYHIDGFRFDLASILSRDRQGNLIANTPIVEAIGEDPMLADTKIIAEAWDAAGAYQVGSFGATRWAEWNGRFRDDVRRFWRGDHGSRGAFATRLAGSSDLYQASGRSPYHSINFVTSHDGFTINDLVSYAEKHNEANGEGNRDGDNNNYSANYGVEGPTKRQDVEQIRRRQVRNLLASTLLAQGAPMLVAGDEVRRTQGGNNNAYCQDNEISWFDWRLVDEHDDVFRFTQALIAFRRREPAVRREEFLRGDPRRPGELPEASWYGPHGHIVDWGRDEHALMCVFAARPEEIIDDGAHHVLVLLHAGTADCDFRLPPIVRAMAWRTFVDTAALSPRDVYPDLDGPAPPDSGVVRLTPRSMVVLVSDGSAAGPRPESTKAPSKRAGPRPRGADKRGKGD